ncbi:MAG: nucleoside recognition domain-containing protein [Hespellia sp.]|nr:nucleoside recognition domain-containing protein [Hespellia sp.]
MEYLISFSNLLIPILIFGIILLSVVRKIDAYDCFVKGAEEGLHTVVRILPTLVGLMVSVSVLRSSGFLEYIGNGIGRVTEQIGFPGELVPLVIVKFFSSSAATGLLIDIFKEFGTDSQRGLIASLILSSTETIFYTMSVYFISAKVTKTRWTLPGALLSALSGVIVSTLLVTGI